MELDAYISKMLIFLLLLALFCYNRRVGALKPASIHCRIPDTFGSCAPLRGSLERQAK
jgi:hypothetical protein